MKAIYLNVQENETPKIIEIEDNLNTYYELIKCRSIDIVRRRIAGKLFEIICDDEALLIQNPKISAINDFGQPMLSGNLIIVGETITEEGDLTGLTNDEVEHIIKYIEKMCTRLYPNGYYMITQCEY